MRPQQLNTFLHNGKMDQNFPVPYYNAAAKGLTSCTVHGCSPMSSGQSTHKTGLVLLDNVIGP